MASEAESEENLLRVGAIPAIDLRFLSQEDLNCLATLSDELRLLRRDDVVVPKIDRSVFNESAGSRRQTYSRLRLAQRKDEAVAVRGGRRRTGLLTVSRHPAGSVDNSGTRDNDLIVSLLRDLFSKENPASSASKNGFPPRVSSPVEGMGARSIGTVGLLEDLSSRPRKRRKKDDARRKMQGSLSQGVRGERLDNGVSSSSAGAQNGVLNVLPLASEDIFVAELNRRTAGLVSEADVLGFLGRLPGRWASRRKKKKFVEASDVGEGLPKGWKILVGIRRKHGRVYVDCRKYISPSGKQFITYKEVYSHLMSSVGSHAASWDISPNLGVDNTSVNKLPPGKSVVAKEDSQKDNSQPQTVVVSLVSTTLSASSDNDGHLSHKVKNPVKDQFRSLLECRQCKVSFCKKEEFMQHLLTAHQRNAKTCRPYKTIGEGVIIKDGKYECQICHKIFEERHRYNGHVGVHVRHYVRSLEALPDEIIVEKNVDQLSHVGVTSMGCEMHSAIGNDSNSLDDGSDVKTNGQQTVTHGSSVNNSEMCIDGNASDSTPRDATSAIVSCATLTNIADEQNNDAAIVHRKEEKVGSVENANGFSNEEDDIANSCLPSNLNGTSDSVKLDVKDKGIDNSANSFDGFHKDLANNSGAGGQKCTVDETSKCYNLDSGFDGLYGDKEQVFKPIVAESAVLVDGKSEKQCKLTDSSSVSLQSSSCLFSHEMKIKKGEDEPKIAGQTDERSCSEKVPVGDSKQPISIPVDLDCGVALVEAIGTSVQPDWDALLPKIVNNHQVTTVCVWCRKEFNHEGIDPETQPDSVGFMCPACKAKISGKLNVLDDGLVKNFDPL
ncbi:uncharacterized protein LOC116258934 [Nymphaea colorata]|nr:uncharacterized protein LOC116258934 [Nymphaea colorata]